MQDESNHATPSSSGSHLVFSLGEVLVQSYVVFSFPLRVHFVIRKGDPGKRSKLKAAVSHRASMEGGGSPVAEDYSLNYTRNPRLMYNKYLDKNSLMSLMSP